VLGDRGEAGQELACLRVADRRGPVEAPAPSGAAGPAEDPVDAVDQVWLVLALDEGAADLAQVCEGPVEEEQLAQVP
jgi:hypothetical protein